MEALRCPGPVACSCLSIWWSGSLKRSSSVPLDSHHGAGSMLHAVDDLMPIGEFSDRSGLSAKRLRTYAAEGLLAPAAVDPGSGYRYYSPGQLADAKMIDALRHAGVSLADIRAFMRLPSEARLDAWARQLHSEASQRQ